MLQVERSQKPLSGRNQIQPSSIPIPTRSSTTQPPGNPRRGCTSMLSPQATDSGIAEKLPARGFSPLMRLLRDAVMRRLETTALDGGPEWAEPDWPESPRLKRDGSVARSAKPSKRVKQGQFF